MGAGMHGINGLSPHVSKQLVTTYVEPVLTYGIEALCLVEENFEDMWQYQRSLLRQIQGLPKSTAIPAIHLLVGIPPITATIHRKVLILVISLEEVEQ